MKTVQEKKRTQKQLEQKGEKTSFHIWCYAVAILKKLYDV